MWSASQQCPWFSLGSSGHPAELGCRWPGISCPNRSSSWEKDIKKRTWGGEGWRKWIKVTCLCSQCREVKTRLDSIFYVHILYFMYTFQYSPVLHIWIQFFSRDKTTTTKKEEASDSIEHLPLCLNLTVVLWLELLPHSKQDLGFNLSPALY